LVARLAGRTLSEGKTAPCSSYGTDVVDVFNVVDLQAR
jgi:hypothetical protein